jgi:hypothetical protein
VGVFGTALYQAANEQVLVADASATTPVIRVYNVANAASIAETTTFDANPKSGLPPRQLGYY